MSNTPSIHYAGELADFDSFAGLIPCKVLSVNSRYNGVIWINEVTIKVTAKNNPVYPYGEVLTTDVRDVLPRDCWKHSRRGPSYIIVNDYVWK